MSAWPQSDRDGSSAAASGPAASRGAHVGREPDPPRRARRSSRSRRTTRSSRTSRARPAPSTSTASSSTRPRSRSCAPPASGSPSRSSARASSSGCSTSGRGSRPGLLHRRPQAPQLARRAGGAGTPGRAARAPPGSGSALARADRAGAARRDADPAELPPEAAPRPARLAGLGLLPAGARGRRRLLRLRRAAGRPIGLVIGDVTDKGVPAAMVMAATRSVLRASAQRVVSPGEVLERVNELMCPDMPAKMFVTCLYGVLEPRTGRFRVRERRPQPSLRPHGRRPRSSCARRACRSA